MKLTENSEKAFEKAKKLLNWNRKILSYSGLWPIMNKFLFLPPYYYFTYHFLKDIVALYYSFGSHNLMKVVGTGMECMTLMQVWVRFWTLKNYSKDLIVILNGFVEDFSIKNYKTEAERKIFLSYNWKSKIFILVNIWALAFTLTLYFFQPLLIQLRKLTCS